MNIKKGRLIFLNVALTMLLLFGILGTIYLDEFIEKKNSTDSFYIEKKVFNELLLYQWIDKEIELANEVHQKGCSATYEKLLNFIESFPSHQNINKLTPIQQSGYKNAINCAIELDKKKRGVTDLYKKLQELSPIDYKIMTAHAEYLYDNGEHKESKKLIERALEIYPPYERAQQLKITLLEKEEKFNEINAFRKENEELEKYTFVSGDVILTNDTFPVGNRVEFSHIIPDGEPQKRILEVGHLPIIRSNQTSNLQLHIESDELVEFKIESYFLDKQHGALMLVISADPYEKP